MANSHAEYPTLVCPQCGASFAAEVWLIVDAAERPEVLARVVAGSIHTVVCPKGHSIELDAPLLIYRPGESRALVFSPAAGATTEQDREIARGLVGLLRGSLGHAWREGWLAEFASSPRELLPAMLSGDAVALQEALAATMPPAVAQVVAELALTLIAEGVVLESPYDLEQALASRPELRARLVAALDAGRAELDSSDDIDAIVAQLSPLTQPEHMPRRVALLRVALEHPAAADPELWAILQGELGNALVQNPLGERADNLEQAIAAFEAALAVFTRDAYPERWATTQNNLGAAYEDRIRGERADNLEQAIAAYEAALTVYTRAAFPIQWAATQNNLGVAYNVRIRGERADNLEQEIAACEAALTVYTRDAFPTDWAMVHSNLGNAYTNRIRGKRADNLERAIAAFTAALEVYTRDTFPTDWAMVHSNLGNAYTNRIRGERADNLERAIAAFTAALEVYTRDAFPTDWAGSQHNLGVVYGTRIRGERADNLERAIAAFTAALEVYTRDAFPADWAMAQQGLANAYRERIRGERADNLEQAIGAYEAALAIYNRAAFPEKWATGQLGLGNAYNDRIRGKRADNLESAIAAYNNALQVYSRHAFPEQWATTQNNLGVAFLDRRQGERADNLEQAIAAYEAATQVRTRDAFPADWAMTQQNLGMAYRARIRGERADNLERAIAAYEAALQVRTRAGAPEQWAMTQNNLGNAYTDRIHGQRDGNLERAIAAYEAALTVYTRGAYPEQWTTAQFNLGIAYGDRLDGERAAILEQAIAAYTAALDGINESFLDLTTISIADSQARWAALYIRLATAQLEAGRPAEALAVAEGYKSRLLTLLVSRSDLPAPPAVPVELVDAERRAAAALKAIDARALAGHNRTEVEPEESIRPRIAGRAAVVADLRAAWAAMEALGPAAADYVALRRGDRPTAATLRALAGALPPGAALLSIFDAVQRTLLFLLPAGAAEPLVIATALDRNDLLHDYLPSYEDEVLNRAAWRGLGRPLSYRWRALGRPLLGALRPHLAGINHLIIAPEGVYHQLPLHALWLSDAGDTLIDHCAVSTIPALGLLARRPAEADHGRQTRDGYRSVVLGYTAADQTTAAGAAERAVFLGEARAVAARLGVEPLLGHAATPAALEAATAEPRRVVHLSCHGYFDPGDALQSGVLLAGGVYTARRFLARRLPAELVTLSACQTGISGSVGGDEMAGLSMALLSAGAGALLLGLWNVNAATTARLMDDFYARLDGAGRAAALRGAMLALRDGTLPAPAGIDPADPYYWAPFVLVGEWR